MKYRFLLDENVLHHAIRGVDEHNSLDLTAAQLVLLIARNCHRVLLNRFLHARYQDHLKALERTRSGVLQPIFLLSQFVNNSAKVVWESDDPPNLPGSANIPAEDVEVVRAALISHPLFVTSDQKLREAINTCPALHLTALTPAEAIARAQES